MGDFSENKMNDIPNEYSVKPSIPDILLMSGAILSIFGLLITFFSAVAGIIFTALSILLFSGSAYYLYSYSQYVRKQYMDIEKHNMLLKKIFKYMKTSFIFWAISLSLIMASLVMNLITQMVLIDPTKVIFSSISEYLFIYFILFFIALLIFLLVFREIYKRLMHQYYFLTGTTNLKGKIRESYEFLYGRNKSKNSILFSKRFLPILGIILILLHLSLPFEWKDSGNYWFFTILLSGLIEFMHKPYWIIAVGPLFFLIMNIIFIVLTLTDKIKKQWILVVGYYAWYSSILFMYFLSYYFYSNKLEIYNQSSFFYALFACILLTIILLIRGTIKINNIEIKRDK
ncbi:hypothetical protein KHQ81_12060 [Mycoplasmatota bacterium]|nr:hypothetical protein KHQ81_12060 [Mycoplasmatota bacterium]